MNIKDRGNKKWNSLLLVEHQKRLKKLKQKEEETDKPEVDPQLLEELGFKIKKALKNKLNVKIKYYSDNRQKVLEGKIKNINKYTKELNIKSDNHKNKNINFKNILDIKLL